MKKCPVCGVEHSDIVPVCSICGSSLANAEIVPDGGAPAANETVPQAAPPAVEEVKAPQPEAHAKPDFSLADIQAAVSSVVSSAVEEHQPHTASPAPEASDPFDDDSPFVENVMKEKQQQKEAAEQGKPAAAPAKKAAAPKKTGDKPEHASGKKTSAKSVRTPGSRRPAPQKTAAKQPQASKEEKAPRAVDPVIDTTAVAAASAQKVRAAKANAVAARERNASAEPENTGSFDWSERKHKRNQPKTNTPVIAAVCALLALLIVAMVFLLGKMVLGDGQEGDGNEGGNLITAGDDQNPDGEEGQDANQPDAANPEGENTQNENQQENVLPENDPNAEDQPEAGDGQDAAEGNNPAGQDGQDGQNAQGQENQQAGQQAGGTDAQQAGETDAQQPGQGNEANQGDGEDDAQQAQRPELPAISETDETVYATGSVRVRDYPSTQYGEVINGLSVGQSVTRTGTTANGWSRVEIGGVVGYVSSNYLSTTRPASGSNGDDDADTAYATAGVNVRETPNGTVVGTLTPNQKVTLTGKTEGNWVQIQTGSLTGYVYDSYLSSQQGGASGGDSGRQDDSDVKITETNDTVYATSGVNVRDYPSSSTGKVLTALTKGQQVTRIGTTSTGWSKIKVGSTTGYVYSGYLSTSKDSASDNGGSSQRTGYILPESNTRKYSRSELSSLSASQLRLARNEIYARHGRKFNDKSLQDYFNGCSWYSGKVDPATFDANINDYLNSYELANLQLITELES